MCQGDILAKICPCSHSYHSDSDYNPHTHTHFTCSSVCIMHVQLTCATYLCQNFISLIAELKYTKRKSSIFDDTICMSPACANIFLS